MDICAVIEEAGFCASKIAVKYVDVATYGNRDEKLFFNLLRINAYIRTLKRNIPETYSKRERVSQEGQSVDFSSLKRENNVLLLEKKSEFRCIEVPIQKCLEDHELRRIVEQINLLCSDC